MLCDFTCCVTSRVVWLHVLCDFTCFVTSRVVWRHVLCDFTCCVTSRSPVVWRCVCVWRHVMHEVTWACAVIPHNVTSDHETLQYTMYKPRLALYLLCVSSVVLAYNCVCNFISLKNFRFSFWWLHVIRLSVLVIANRQLCWMSLNFRKIFLL